MLEELQVINHWLDSKDPVFLVKNSVSRNYFSRFRHVVDYIEKFADDNSQQMPTKSHVQSVYEEFDVYTELDPLSYCITTLKNERASFLLRNFILKGAEQLNNGTSKPLELIGTLKNELETYLKLFTSGQASYDWVNDALTRYEEYMTYHNQSGLRGLPTGLVGLDDATSGWLNDDFILLSGRLNEGKSLIGGYFAFKVWMHFQVKKIPKKVVYISTEMSDMEVAFRLDTLKANFSNKALLDGSLQNPELYKDYLAQLKNSEYSSFEILTHESNGGRPFNPTDIRRILENNDVGFIVIDQLYDLQDNSNERDIRKRIVNLSRTLRDINLSCNVPMMVLAQAGRESAKDARKDTNATPELDQIQESDSPAQKATIVITLRKFDENAFKISLKKNRRGKRNLDFKMAGDIDTGFWREINESSQNF